jgi:hypothetical protein
MVPSKTMVDEQIVIHVFDICKGYLAIIFSLTRSLSINLGLIVYTTSHINLQKKLFKSWVLFLEGLILFKIYAKIQHVY